MKSTNKKDILKAVNDENPNTTKVYNIQFDDGSYLILNVNAVEEKDIFKSTPRLDRCTLINESLLLEVERLINSYSGRLYVSNHIFEREMKLVTKIGVYELNKLEEVDY